MCCRRWTDQQQGVLTVGNFAQRLLDIGSASGLLPVELASFWRNSIREFENPWPFDFA